MRSASSSLMPMPLSVTENVSCLPSARTLTEKYLARIEAIDRKGPALNSVIEVNPDALAIADAMDKERQEKSTRGPLHGYGIARRIEQTSGDLLAVNYGTLYPALLKLEQEGYISSEWGFSDNNRKAKYYKLTRAGRKQLNKEEREWEQTTAILARFLAPGEERS